MSLEKSEKEKNQQAKKEKSPPSSVLKQQN